MISTVVVIGAAGDVGQGIVAALLESGAHVVAVGRTKARLDAVAVKSAGAGTLDIVVGSVADEKLAAELLAAVKSVAPSIDAVVVSVNEPAKTTVALEMTAAEFLHTLKANVVSHLVAAKTFLPTVRDGGSYIVIGGGMADFIFPGQSHVSASQAALRNLVRGIAAELGETKVHFRELLIASMVNGESKREIADPRWLTDVEIGRHICAILTSPQAFPGPVLTLRSRKQIGQPDPA